MASQQSSGKKSGKGGKKTKKISTKADAAAFIADETEVSDDELDGGDEDDEEEMEVQVKTKKKTSKKTGKKTSTSKTGGKSKTKTNRQPEEEEEEEEEAEEASDSDDTDAEESSSGDDAGEAHGSKRKHDGADDDKLAEDMTVSLINNLGWDPLSKCPVAITITQLTSGSRRELIELEFTNPPNKCRFVAGRRILQYTLSANGCLHLQANIRAISRTATHLQLYVPNINRHLYTIRNPVYDLSSGDEIIIDMVNICKRDVVFKSGDVLVNAFAHVAPAINFSIITDVDEFKNSVEEILKDAEINVPVSEKHCATLYETNNIYTGPDGCKILSDGVWSSSNYAKILVNHPSYSS